MNKFLLVLSIFAVSAFLALTVGVSQALAGKPAPCAEICGSVSGACDGTDSSCFCVLEQYINDSVVTIIKVFSIVFIVLRY